MKKTFAIVFMLIYIQLVVYSQEPQPEIEFSKTYGGPLSDLSRMVRQLPDGGYLIAGDTRNHTGGRTDSDIYLIRTNSQGDVLWTHEYGATNLEERITWAMENSLQIIYDANGSINGYLMVGTVQTNDPLKGIDVILVKTDANGLEIWTKTYGGDSDDYGRVVKIAANGDFIIVGLTFSYQVQSNDVYVIRVNSAGDNLWEATYNLNNYEDGYDIMELPGGDFLITGATYGTNGGAFLFKINNNGDPNSTFGNYSFQTCQGSKCRGGGKFYTLNSAGTGYNIEKISGGEFMLVGTKSDGADAFMTKLNSFGVPVFTKNIEVTGENNAYVVHEVSTPGAPGFIVAGEILGPGTGAYDFWLFKTDLNGNILWQKTYGGINSEWCTSMCLTSDEGLALTGVNYSYGNAGGDFWLLKLRYCLDDDQDGYTTCSGDCDDSNANINPGMSEICHDGIDNNCDGLIDKFTELTTQSLIDFFNTGVNNGTITEMNGNGNLNAFLNKLNQAKNTSNTGTAINALLWCLERSDGKSNPKDFIIGTGVPVLNSMIQEVINNINCSGIVLMPKYSSNEGEYLEIRKKDKLAEDFEIFPNPTNDKLQIDLVKYLDQTISICIINQLGQKLIQIPEQKLLTPQISIDFSTMKLPIGIYYIYVNSSEGQHVKRFIINE